MGGAGAVAAPGILPDDFLRSMGVRPGRAADSDPSCVRIDRSRWPDLAGRLCNCRLSNRRRYRPDPEPRSRGVPVIHLDDPGNSCGLPAVENLLCATAVSAVAGV